MIQLKRILLCALATIAVALLLTRPEVDAPLFQALVMALAITSFLTLIFLCSQRDAPVWASISFLFGLSYLIVNLNIPMLRLFEIEVTGTVHGFIWSDKDVFNLSASLSAAGLCLFCLGVALTQHQNHHHHDATPASEYVSAYLAPLTFALFLAFLATAGSFAVGDYSATGASRASSYFYKLFKVTLTALIILKVTNYFVHRDRLAGFPAYLDHLGWPLLTTLVPFMAIAFVAGDRGPLIFFVMLTLGPYLASRGAFGFLATATIAYGAAIGLSVLGAARQARFGGATFLDRVSAQISEGSWLHVASYRFDQPVVLGHTLELAASVRVLNHSLANVPSRYDYGFGTFASQQIASVIPGLGGLINTTIWGGDWRMDGSSNFATYLIQGPHPSYGDGTTVTGELYLDFGIAGVLLGLFVFGLIVGRVEHRIFTGSTTLSLAWIFTLIYFANALYLARSSLLLELSNVLLVYLTLICLTRRRPVDG